MEDRRRLGRSEESKMHGFAFFAQRKFLYRYRPSLAVQGGGQKAGPVFGGFVLAALRAVAAGSRARQ